LQYNGKVRVSFGSGANYRLKESNSVLINNDKWYHLLGVINSKDNIKIYVNGVEKDGTLGGNATSITSNSLPLLIAMHASPSWYFQGIIDEVRIYRSTPTAGEVQKLYAEGLERHISMNNEQ